MTRDAQQSVVIGGGVIGAMTAYYLAKSGRRVTIIDRDRLGGACSHGNCGFVCPSHVLPLAAPGAIRATLPLLLRKNSPFRIKFGFDTRRLKWFTKFAAKCRKESMLEGAKAKHDLLQWSKTLYEQLLSDESIQCEWEEKGLLFVYRTEKEFDEYAETNELLEREFGVVASRYDSRELRALEPALTSVAAGGWHYESDRHLRSDKLLSQLRGVLEKMGVSIVENCEVTRIVKERNRVVAVRTPQGDISGDSFIVATGAMTPLLEKEIGFEIPIQPGKGYSMTMPRPKICPKIPMIFEEDRVAVTPFQSGYRLGSMMEFVGYDQSIETKRLNLLKRAAKDYLVEPYVEGPTENWYGWRPMVYDDKPIIGPVPNVDNMVLATGHGMLGLSMAPATGRLVTEILDNATPSIPLASYSPQRF